MTRAPITPVRAAAIALLVGFAPLSAHAADGPPPPPKPEQVKSCLDDFAQTGNWKFDYTSVTIGQPRHPLNAYEIGRGSADVFGYPVRAVFTFNGLEKIDGNYWFTLDPQGHWQVAGMCKAK